MFIFQQPKASMAVLFLFAGTSRKAWRGRAMAVIKSTQQPGIISLKVRLSELPEAIIKLKASL